MNTFDFSPLFRSGVGFDRLARLAESTLRHSGEQATSWPPYNIEKTGEDSYAITLAVAGFPENDLDVEVHDDLLVVRGDRSPLAGNTDAAPNNGDQGDRRYLHRGIAFRSFVRHFQLADHMTVTGAHLENGLLTITLVRKIPEASKPRHIAIATEAKALPSAA